MFDRTGFDACDDLVGHAQHGVAREADHYGVFVGVGSQYGSARKSLDPLLFRALLINAR